jgi:hypothetical protein
LELRCLKNEYIAGRFVNTTSDGDESFWNIFTYENEWR